MKSPQFNSSVNKAITKTIPEYLKKILLLLTSK